jgi:hypothetical protein
MCSAVCIGADDDMEKRRAEILESAKACDTGDGVIVLTDMFGGTPSNLAISIMEQARIEVLAGVNLPMLVKLASVRTRPIAEAVRMAQEAGRNTSPSPRASWPRKLRDGCRVAQGAADASIDALAPTSLANNAACTRGPPQSSCATAGQFECPRARVLQGQKSPASPSWA